MTSKEALEKILNSPTVIVRQGSFLDIELIKLINQDLDRLEKLEKVVEIIAEKLEVFVNRAEYGTPYIKCWQQSMGITEKEYELLKEVLENGF